MLKRIKSVLFVICLVMAFTAQANRPDDKERKSNQSRQQEQPRAEASKPSSQTHNNQSRQQEQTRRVAPREAPQEAVRRETQTVQTHALQSSHQQRQGPRVYAVPTSAPIENNNLFHRQHHNGWRPRYNFYNNQYHFYPYVVIPSSVELLSDVVSAVFNGQTYFYDQGTFYVQDESGQYVAVEPPVGIIVNPIAPEARQIDVNGQIYYRYKGVFYVQVDQGYQVVEPVQSSDDS